jgi:PAS domain-containing protein
VDSVRRRREDSQFLDLSERFKFATEAAQIGYWFCDLPFDKLIWDARVKEHFWLPPDADVDIGLFYQSLHPGDRDRTRQAIETSIANHTSYDIEYRTVSAEGREKWIRAIGRTAYDSIGTPIRFDGITQDVTSLKSTQQELLLSEERIRVALQSVDIVLYTTDLDLRYTWMYRAHPAYPAERMLGRRDIDVEPEQCRELHAFKQSVLASGVPGHCEISFMIDGKPEFFAYTAEPLRDSKGSICGLTVACLNVTQMRLAEDTLRKTEKLAVVGRLAASIAHEINNPLESVVSLLYVARSMATDEELRTYLATAEEELYRVAHIVTHSLRFNRQSTDPGEAKVSALMESALALYRGRLNHSSIQVITQFRDSEPLLCLPS